MDGQWIQLLVHVSGLAVGAVALLILVAAAIVIWALRNWEYLLLGALCFCLFAVIDHGLWLRHLAAPV
jgi:hypothetical protein